MYHIYSHNDLDGVGCGILARLAWGEQVEVRYNSIASLNHQVSRFLETATLHEHLLVTDLSVNEENEEKINEFVAAGGKVNLLDHHKTALPLNEHSWAHVQVTDGEGRLTCATSLLYEYLVKNKFLQPSPAVEEFVELVRLYDTWDWERQQNVKAKQLNDLLFLISLEEFADKMVERLQTADTFTFDEFEEKVLHMEHEKIQRYMRKKKRELVQANIKDACVGVIHAELYHSELGNELGKSYEHLDYIAIVNMSGRKLSFRTIHDDADVSVVAGTFGGGGHVKASGCPLTEEAYKLYVEQPFFSPFLKEDAAKNTYNIKQAASGALYQNHQKQLYFLHPIGEQWAVAGDQLVVEQQFPTFEEAERFIKRKYACWLTNDEAFLSFLKSLQVQS